MGSSNTDSFGNLWRTKDQLDEVETDLDFVPLEEVEGVYNAKDKAIKVNIEVLLDEPRAMEPMSKFSILESMSLTEGNDGFFITTNMCNINA